MYVYVYVFRYVGMCVFRKQKGDKEAETAAGVYICIYVCVYMYACLYVFKY